MNVGSRETSPSVREAEFTSHRMLGDKEGYRRDCVLAYSDNILQFSEVSLAVSPDT